MMAKGDIAMNKFIKIRTKLIKLYYVIFIVDMLFSNCVKLSMK